MIGLFILRVETGCLILGRCAFTTLTYKVDGRLTEDVGYVRKDWTAFCRQFLRPHGLRWLKVTERTRKGIPHHHVVIGTIGSDEEVNCYGDRLVIRRYEQRFDTCACLSHRAARTWEAITKDSYIVHTREVHGEKHAGRYMAKYMRKTFKAPVFTRRWATSHGWPGGGRLRLKQTDEEGWSRKEFWYGHYPEVRNPKDLVERAGPEWALKRMKAKDIKRMQKEIIRRLT